MALTIITLETDCTIPTATLGAMTAEDVEIAVAEMEAEEAIDGRATTTTRQTIRTSHSAGLPLWWRWHHTIWCFLVGLKVFALGRCSSKEEAEPYVLPSNEDAA
jgi:hypothetical protein